MKKRLTLGLATLVTLVGLGGAAQAQVVPNAPGAGWTDLSYPSTTIYRNGYVYPSSSSYYYNYDTTPTYYNSYPSSSYYYNYDTTPSTTWRNSYYRNSRGFPAAHERQNYYYDNNGNYIRYR